MDMPSKRVVVKARVLRGPTVYAVDISFRGGAGDDVRVLVQDSTGVVGRENMGGGIVVH